MKKHSFLVMFAGFLCGSVCFLLILSMVSESVQLRAQNEELQAEIERLTDGNAQQKTEIARLQTALAAEMASPYRRLIEETRWYTMRHPQNSNMLIVETRERLTNRYETLDRGWANFAYSFEPSIFKASIKELVRSLLKIEGIVYVSVDEHKLIIHRTDAYIWEQLLPVVRPLIMTEFGDKSIKEIGAVPGIEKD